MKQKIIIRWGKAVWKWAGPFKYFKNGEAISWDQVPLPVRYLFAETLLESTP